MKNRIPHSKKDGAALIIALGFLALLTITIVAFSVQMRTERLAGRGYLSAAQNRQLLHTALSRALEDIEMESSGTNYPDFLALGSLESSGDYLADDLDFSTEDGYLPGSNSLIYAEYLDVLNNETQWQAIDGPNGRPIGRVGYIILNTSGLLDANSVGGINRSSGISPQELSIDPSLLYELAPFSTNNNFALLSSNGESTSDASRAFTVNREAAWNRFESLRDVKTLNQDDDERVIISQPESFSTFSLFPSSTNNRVELSATIDPATFTNILGKCNLTTEEASAVYESYLDYIDTDDIPSTLSGSTTEAVPMINEVAIENLNFLQETLDPTNVIYKLSGDLYVETWYPFANTHSTNSTLELRSAKPDKELADEILEGAGFIGDEGFITITVVYEGNVGKSFILKLFSEDPEITVSGNFMTTHYNFGFDQLVSLSAALDEDAIAISIHILEESIEVITDAPVDRVENIRFEFNNESSAIFNSQYASAIDPRINHDFQNATHWSLDLIGSENTINRTIDWGEESELTQKSNIRFYVRNGPMRNAAELSHLSTGIPWRTVRLYGGQNQTLHPVLDYFHVNETRWTASKHPGLINLNSPHTNVLATAFLNAPIQNTPTNTSFTVSSDLALQLSSNLLALSGASHNLSKIGLAVSNNIPGWAEFTDAQKDSIVGNTYRLFGWRDTHYTLLLAAQTLAGDEVQSTQQAVAHIWRDPVTGKCACVFYGLSSTLRSSIGGSHLRWTPILQAFKP